MLAIFRNVLTNFCCCSLLNRSQRSLEHLIRHISLEDLQFSRDSNIQNFVNACQGLPSLASEGMVVGDISDPLPASTHRIVLTIVALAKLTGPDLPFLSPSCSGTLKHDLAESTPSSPEDMIVVTPATPRPPGGVQELRQRTTISQRSSGTPSFVEHSSPADPSPVANHHSQVGVTGRRPNRLPSEKATVKSILRMQSSLTSSSISGTTFLLHGENDQEPQLTTNKRSSTLSLIHSSLDTRSSNTSRSESRVVSFDLIDGLVDLGNISRPVSLQGEVKQTKYYATTPTAPTTPTSVRPSTSYSLGNSNPILALSEISSESTRGMPRMGLRRHSAQGKIYVPKGTMSSSGNRTSVSERSGPSALSPKRSRSQSEGEPTTNKRVVNNGVVIVRGTARTSIYVSGKNLAEMSCLTLPLSLATRQLHRPRTVWSRLESA